MLATASPSLPSPQPQGPNPASAEANLLLALRDGQLRPHGVTEARLLTRVMELPRSRFAPSGTELTALYADQPCALTATRSLLSPRLSARLLQALHLNEGSRVLVLGAATGYEATLIAPWVASLTACEDDPALTPLLRANLKPYPHAAVLPNPPTRLPAVSEPFTHILLASPFEALPPKLGSILTEGGKLGGVRATPNGVATAVCLTRHGQTWLEEALLDGPAGPPHPALRADEVFVF